MAGRGTESHVGAADNIGFPKGQCPFGRVQRQRLWQGLGQRPKVDRRSTMPSGAPQRVNFKTVQWTV
ncbi:MAG: hypothetical protein J6K77_05125, partial [Ruminococcus sp.]|nr:hypothetical protein [Ruminococcus sp.]